MDRSNLVPLLEAKPLDWQTWDIHTDDLKFELWSGTAFDPNGNQRDRLAICLIYNMGLRHFVEMLPD